MRHALLAGAVAAIALVPSLAPAAPRPATSPLLAGAHALDVQPPVGVPLAGYGGTGRRLLFPDILRRHPYAFWFAPSVGIHDPIMARALVLQSGDRRVLWLTVDLVAVDSEIVGELRERLATLGLAYDLILLSASHTHSGPGGFSRSRLMAFLALDAFVPDIRERLVGSLAQAAWAADRGKVPAHVGIGRAELTGLTRSRVRRTLDPELGVLKILGTDGRPVAAVWNYAIHGTVLGKANRLLSGDVTGVATLEVERALGVPALYTNGAVGDVSPARHGQAALAEMAGPLAREVVDAWRRTPVERAGLGILSHRLALPPPRLSLRNCLGRWLPRRLTVGIGWALSAEAELAAVSVGRSAWVAVPGELQTRLGLQIKREGRRLFGHAFIVGVTNGYGGYFLAPEDYDRPSYIACASLYGDGGGPLVATGAIDLLRRLRERGD